jgi:SAM-dependent methyltransferase
MAIPMAQEFSRLRYEGFDVSQKAIDWCRAEISKPHPSFNFTLVDARNGWYNPKGAVEPGAVRFPYQDGQFDLAILVSVFTHMTPDVVRHYLAELARVVKPAGRLFATAFLMDERARQNVSNERSSIKLIYRVAGDQGFFWTTSLNCPESAVGFHPKELLWMFDQAGFTATVHRGRWDGGEGLAGHDIISGVRRA